MSEADTSSNAPAVATQPAQPQTRTEAQEKTRPKSQELPPFNVILLDDDDHTYEYVVLMLRRVFGHAEDRGFQLAKQVDEQGRAIVLTTHKEHAELKRDQILGFGSDPRLATSRGSMGAVVEPANAE